MTPTATARGVVGAAGLQTSPVISARNSRLIFTTF
jgi:hypothetical protein